MKNVLLLFFIMLFYNPVATCQIFPLDEKTGEIMYSEVVSLENVSKEDLYLRANDWFVKNFQSAKNVIQFSDQSAGKIMGRGKFGLKLKVMGSNVDAGQVSFLIEVALKEGRYKYTLSELDMIPNPGTPDADLLDDKPGKMITKNAWKSVREQTHENAQLLIKSLKIAMATQTDSQEDW